MAVTLLARVSYRAVSVGADRREGCLIWAANLRPCARAQQLALVPARCMNLFVLAGQSNMAGRAALPSDIEASDPAIRCFTQCAGSEAWTPAADPLHADKPEKAGVGPGLPFARELRRAEPSLGIGLVSCAWGGSEDSYTTTTKYRYTRYSKTSLGIPIHSWPGVKNTGFLALPTFLALLACSWAYS